MNKLSWVKNNLATLSTSSLRYRFVTTLFSKDTVDSSKACTFYWVMLPATAVGVVVLGAFAIIITTVFWIVGYAPTFFTDKGLSSNQTPTANYAQPGNSKGTAYRYKYNPRTGKTSRFAPWQLLLPLSLAILLVFNSSIFSQFADFMVAMRFVWLGITLVMAFFYVVGKLVIHNHQKISARWNELCPPLVVEQESETVN